MIIQSADIKVRVPITCHKCKQSAMSDSQRVSVNECTIETLIEVLRMTKVGVYFPVGWASHYTRDGTIHLCPKCNQ